MLNLKDILQDYPEHLRVYREFILREYLQHKILQFMYDSAEHAKSCVFWEVLVFVLYMATAVFLKVLTLTILQ